MGSHLERMRSLLEAPAAAVLSTYRKDGTVKLSPVWFRHEGDHFEVVITDDDVKSSGPDDELTTPLVPGFSTRVGDLLAR